MWRSILTLLALLVMDSEGIAFVTTKPTLQCTKDGFSVNFGSAQSVTGLEVEKNPQSSQIAGCKTTSKQTITWGLAACGNTVTYSQDTTKIKYSNTVVGPPVAITSDSGIDRGHVIKVLVTCEFARVGSTTAINWKAGQASTDEKGTGTFTFTLTGFTDQGRSAAIDPNTPINLRTKLYFTVTCDVPSALQVGMTVTTVQACTSATCSSTPKYDLVTAGCVSDSTYAKENGANKLERKFNFDAFYFNERPTDEVYLIVTLNLCKYDSSASENAYTTCLASCASGTQGRRKRAADNDLSQQAADGSLFVQSAELMGDFRVYAGPYQIVDPDAKKDSAGNVIYPSFALILIFIAVM